MVEIIKGNDTATDELVVDEHCRVLEETQKQKHLRRQNFFDLLVPINRRSMVGIVILCF